MQFNIDERIKEHYNIASKLGERVKYEKHFHHDGRVAWKR